MLLKPWLRGVLVGLGGALLAASAHANFPSVPKETYKALNLEQSASPKQLHEALVKRYPDHGMLIAAQIGSKVAKGEMKWG